MKIITSEEFRPQVARFCEEGFFPCPWCGSVRLYIGHHDWESVGVQCLKCRTWGPVVKLPDQWNLPDQTMFRRMLTTAWKRWNRRVGFMPQAGELYR